ncbi:MAG: hypothetical protein ACXACI_17515, partial [Candidatus Hodarchaeales archaeon]
PRLLISHIASTNANLRFPLERRFFDSTFYLQWSLDLRMTALYAFFDVVSSELFPELQKE